MNKFVCDKPINPSFSRGGADGYNFSLQNNNIEIDYINSKTGHGGKVISDSITHYYYILEGSGVFLINGSEYPVKGGQLAEIPPKHSFDYRGKMKMLLIMEPPFKRGVVIESK